MPSRTTGADNDTVMPLLVEVGENCSIFQGVTLRGLNSMRIQADENWSLVVANMNAHSKRSVS